MHKLTDRPSPQLSDNVSYFNPFPFKPIALNHNSLVRNNTLPSVLYVLVSPLLTSVCKGYSGSSFSMAGHTGIKSKLHDQEAGTICR